MPAAFVTAAVTGYGIYTNHKDAKAGRDAQGAADPFASQRGQYQEDLQKLMKGEFTPSDPSYKWRFDQGMESVNRGAAASGLLRSGNRLAQLADYGQGQASTEYANQFSRLSQLAGANIGSPAAAGQIAANNSANSSAYLQQLGGQVGGMVKNWWDGLNTGGGTETTGYGGAGMLF